MSNTKLKSSNENKASNNVASKLRRLKIEENILLQSLKKLDQKRNYEVSELYTNNDIDCSDMIKKLNDSYLDLKNLFDDLKTITRSRDLLAELEIDEIKSKVLELEKTMKLFQSQINIEQNTLINEENELIKQLEQIHFQGANVKKQVKISSASFKQAVPSPVGLLMTSPLKYTEVQEFQDFMKNSPNRFGGWNEYHHNIFVKLWQKHFGNSDITEFNEPNVQDLCLNNFIDDAFHKLQGIDMDNIKLHIEWYKKYLFYKSKQQIAIDRWKAKKRSIRKVSAVNHTLCSVPNAQYNGRKSKKVEPKKIPESAKPVQNSKRNVARVMAPTQQWISRCECEQKFEQIQFVDDLNKLRIPNWRKYL